MAITWGVPNAARPHPCWLQFPARRPRQDGPGQLVERGRHRVPHRRQPWLFVHFLLPPLLSTVLAINRCGKSTCSCVHRFSRGQSGRPPAPTGKASEAQASRLFLVCLSTLLYPPHPRPHGRPSAVGAQAPRAGGFAGARGSQVGYRMEGSGGCTSCPRGRMKPPFPLPPMVTSLRASDGGGCFIVSVP